MIQITVPLVPPSVNHYVKHTRGGRHYRSAEAQAFLDAVAVIAPKSGMARGRSYFVGIAILLGKGQRGDIDNFAKCVLDGLVAAGTIDTDSKVKVLKITLGRDVKFPRTVISVGVLY